MADDLTPHIERLPGVCGGRPKIAGKRFTVQHVYVLHERLRMTPEEIADGYDLTLAEVFAALAYAFDHQLEIEGALREEEDFVEEFKKHHPSRLKEILRERSRQVLPG